MIKIIEHIPTAEEYNKVSLNVGWGVRPDEIVTLALQNTLISVCAYDDGELVGYGRIIGDGATFLYVQDVMVKKEYQSQKIGTGIIKKLLECMEKYWKINPSIRLYLGAALGKEDFYKPFGFVVREEVGLGPGMIYRKK